MSQTARTIARPSVRKSAAARARKLRQRYLTEVIDAGGAIVGFRFNPGPHLRAAGVRSTLLKRDDGSWMGEAEARAFRDRALKAAGDGKAAAPIVVETPTRRTLNALWLAFEAHHDKLAADRDEEALGDKTRAFYRSMIKPWLAWGGDELVAAFDAETIVAEYKAQKKARGHSAAHAGLRALMAVLAHGVFKKWIATNPALKLKLARPKGRLRLGSPAEMNALVAAADALGEKQVGDAIVAALWTSQRLGDLLACDLAQQLVDGMLIFARTHEADFSQAKRDGQAQVLVLEPLRLRIGRRTTGMLIEPRRSRTSHTARDADGRRDGERGWNVKTFNNIFTKVRAEAMKTCPSLADFEFRDLRDTAVTRLHLAGIDLASIAFWSGHSLKTIADILAKHYLVSTRDGAVKAGETFDAWRVRAGIKW